MKDDIACLGRTSSPDISTQQSPRIRSVLFIAEKNRGPSEIDSLDFVIAERNKYHLDIRRKQ